jgi:hypothetical protein
LGFPDTFPKCLVDFLAKAKEKPLFYSRMLVDLLLQLHHLFVVLPADPDAVEALDDSGDAAV